MSKVQLDQFYKKVGEDEALKGKLMALRGSSKEVYGKIAEIAQAEGYDVEAKDFDEAFAKGAELSEEELNAVAGGCYQGDPECSSVCGECCGTFLGTYIGKQ